MQDSIVDIAKQRFALAAEAENECRENRLDDVKFVRLGEQWPDTVKRDRERPGQERPMLTINRLFQFRNQIINEIRQNRPSIKVRPVDDDADVDTAEILQGIVRHIQDVSRADIAYDTATEWQVDSGLGYIHVTVDYCGADSFDQDVVIKRVPDSFKVYFDPASTEPDGSDAKWALIVEEHPLDSWEKENQKSVEEWAEKGRGDDWVSKDTIRIAEYYYIEDKPRTLAMLKDGSTAWKDEIPKEAAHLIIRERESSDKICKWAKIAGSKIVDETEIPTTFIPIVPVLGSEIWVEGRRHLHGLTRFAKDAARQYNYMQSANTELLALAPRAPYIAAEGQLDGYEQDWKMANRVNLSVLTYNPVTIGGQLAPAPQRQMAPQANPGFESAMARAIDDMKSSMGIFDASLGNHEAEQSGKAIQSQQAQASVGNFHFADNLSRSIRQVGRIVIEMIPKIYDSARVARMLGEDGTPKNVKIDPNQPQAKTEVQDDAGEIQTIYNLNVGKYDVVVDTGPSYLTKRQEAVASQMQFVQADPSVLQVAGDLIVKNMDWPDAEAIAKRMKAAMNPQIIKATDEEEGKQQIDPQIEAQMNQMADMVQHLSQELHAAQAQLQSKEDELDIKRFGEQTKRMQVEATIAQNDFSNIHAMAIADLEHAIAQGNTGEAEDTDKPEQPVEMTQTTPGGANE